MSTTELPPDSTQDPSEQSPEELDATNAQLLTQLNDLVKQNNGHDTLLMDLKARIVGLLEQRLMHSQALLDVTQVQLNRAHLSLRLSVRAQAGLLSPEERAPLERM